MQCNRRKVWMMALIVWTASLGAASATERRFAYTYEPEVLPAGAAEFEQWVTLRAGRSDQAGKANFTRWDIREEFEYGVTDRYSAALYLNGRHDSYKDTDTGVSTSEFKFRGVSLENRYMLWNPAERAVGLTLYLEPRYSGEEAALEQKIIIGQRHGDWKWALNLVHETEWNLHEHETEGELELDFGLSRQMARRWSLGCEFRVVSEIEEYREWKHVALFLGTTVNYTCERWWATLAVQPQIYGRNFDGNPDGNRNLVLDNHERVEVRLLIGISF